MLCSYSALGEFSFTILGKFQIIYQLSLKHNPNKLNALTLSRCKVDYNSRNAQNNVIYLYLY